MRIFASIDRTGIMLGKGVAVTQENTVDRMAELLRALGHPVRIKVIEMLAAKDTCFCQMQEALSLEQSSLSQHLQVLRRMGLVSSRKAANQTMYRLTNRQLPQLLETVRLAIEGPEQKPAAVLGGTNH